MKKYVFLFVGGNPKPEDQQTNMKEWMDWIGSLGDKYESGLPFIPAGKKVKGPENTVEDMADSEVSGYMVVKAESMDEAVAMAKEAPHQALGGKTKVWEAMDMPGM